LPELGVVTPRRRVWVRGRGRGCYASGMAVERAAVWAQRGRRV